MGSKKMPAHRAKTIDDQMVKDAAQCAEIGKAFRRKLTPGEFWPMDESGIEFVEVVPVAPGLRMRLPMCKAGPKGGRVRH